MTQRARRTEEQRIADLEAQIAALQARAERKKLKRDPSLKHVSAALRSIDKALEASDDAPTRGALAEARATLSACLSLNGVVAKAPGKSGAPRGRRTNSDLGEMSDLLMNFVRSKPGQRGEQIAAALGTDVGTMRRPMKGLIEAGKVKTKGQRRGMQYFAA